MGNNTLQENAWLRYTTFFYLYIMQGIPAGFALTTLSNYLLGNQIAPQKVGAFIAIFGIPWTLQFVWGPLIDRYQFSVMGHRKHWILLSQLMTVIISFGLLRVKYPLQELPLLSGLFFVYSIFASIEVASVDAMAITIAPGKQRGRLNGCMRGGYLIGTAFGAAALSPILHNYGFQTAALVQAIILLLFTIAFFFTRTEEGDVLLPWLKSTKLKLLKDTLNPPLALVFRKIFAAITDRKSARYLALVALVYFLLQCIYTVIYFYLIHVLKWSDNTVSLLQGSWGSIVTFAAIIIAGFASDKIGAKNTSDFNVVCLLFFDPAQCVFSFLEVFNLFWYSTRTLESC